MLDRYYREVDVMFGKKENPTDKTIISVKAYSGGVQEVTVEAQSLPKAYGLFTQLRKDLKLQDEKP